LVVTPKPIIVVFGVKQFQYFIWRLVVFISIFFLNKFKYNL